MSLKISVRVICKFEHEINVSIRVQKEDIYLHPDLELDLAQC